MPTARPIAYRRRERGWVFLLASVILMVLLLLGASLIERSQNTLYRTSVDNRAARSFQIAEGGLHRALWALNQHNGWLTYSGEQPTPFGGGYYEVEVSPSPVERDPNTSHLTILAAGYLGGANGAKVLQRRIHATVGKDPRYFSYAVFGNETVRVGNGTVTVKADSYDSRDGAYGGGNVKANADVGTNSTAAGAVEILPMGEVRGDVTVGAGAEPPGDCVSNKGLVTGTISAADAPVLLPSIRSIPSAAKNLGDVWLDGGSQLVHTEGSYYLTDLDMFGASRIVCYGKVVLYIDCSTDADSPDIRIGGNGIVNTSGIPSNLTIYCRDDVTNVTVSGASSLYGGIYAPKAEITLNSGTIYGSVIGGSVNMNGATSHVHYDEALHDPANPHAVMCTWHAL